MNMHNIERGNLPHPVNLCTGDTYTCYCGECQFRMALEAYDEILAETGSSAYYGGARYPGDAMIIAREIVGPPPQRADFDPPATIKPWLDEADPIGTKALTDEVAAEIFRTSHTDTDDIPF